MTTWVLLAALACAIWYFFLRPSARSNATSTTPAAPSVTEASQEALRDADPTLVLSDEERSTQQAASSADKWRQEARTVEERHRDAMQPLKEKLQKIQKLIKDSGVGDAACAILRYTWHWPSWSQRDDWKPPLAIEGLTGHAQESDEKAGGRVSWIGWTAAGSKYRLMLTVFRSHGDSSSTHGALALIVDESEVLVLDVSNRLEDEYDIWNMFGVSAFKAGPWMAQLNELAGRLQIARQEALRANELKFYGEKASKIEL